MFSSALPEAASQEHFDCRACGACCAYSRDWPRFSMETDAEIASIPAQLINRTGSGMRCVGDRCSALIGAIGRSTSCGIYAVRPEVCRACQPGDDACRMARERHGLGRAPDETRPRSFRG
jgi:uncharacterized protein